MGAYGCTVLENGWTVTDDGLHQHIMKYRLLLPMVVIVSEDEVGPWCEMQGGLE